jgi:ATP-dependent helicase HrpB
VARRLDTGSRRCELVHGRRGVLSEESVVEAPLLVACDVREVESGSRRDRALRISLGLATAIEEAWLGELFPQDVNEARAVVYDPSLGRVIVRSERRFRDLLLQQEVSRDAPRDDAAKLLAREVLAGRVSLENWNDGVEQWILRLNLLREWMPELELPRIGDEERVALIEHVCDGACSAQEVKKRPVLPVVRSWLSRQQQDWLEQYAPERLALPNGRAPKVLYSQTAVPTVASRIQDLYGVRDGLWIASHRVRVRVQVLAPSNRPVQVTENLSDFWRETYPKLKAQLQRRYPKHEWR